MSENNILINTPSQENNNFFKINLKNILIRSIIILICFPILFKMFMLIDEKKNYDSEILYDSEDSNIEVVEFPIKSDWKPFGKVTVNPKSIPNLKTFYVAAVNPKERAEIKLFSTQFETDIKETEIYGLNEDVSEILPIEQDILSKTAQNYMLSVLKTMNPHAENIKIIKNYIKPNRKATKKYKLQENFLRNAYMNMNPTTEKSKSTLENIKAEPVSILFSFYEDGYHYYQRFDCDFMFFTQIFNETMKTKKIRQIINYIKCANVYSYKVLAKYYKSNLREYNVFKKNTKVNNEWVEMTDEKRRELIHLKNYVTTQTIMAGDKFKPDSLKNLIYTIEYMNSDDKKYLTEDMNVKI